ncbi:unnamed protein product, partial [Discosporangium mesarthrocarpum]
MGDGDGEGSQDSEQSHTLLEYWAMKNLWQGGVSNDRRLRVRLVDTVLLKDGHLVTWYFTSSKTGEILKRSSKRLDWGELIVSFTRQVKEGRSSVKIKGDGSQQGKIAVGRRLRDGRIDIFLLSARDIRDLTEKHNAHKREEIVALHPYITRKPFFGCGVFLNTFERRGRSRGALTASATFELAFFPPDRDWRPEGAMWGGVRAAGECKVKQSVFERKMRDCKAARVDGVIHRVLQGATKDVVGHVERETGEVFMWVVAQYAFTPGSGQPVLLFIDSAETIHSQGPDSEAGDLGMAYRALTRDWQEVDQVGHEVGLVSNNHRSSRPGTGFSHILKS